MAESKRDKQKHHLIQRVHPLMIKRILDHWNTKMFPTKNLRTKTTQRTACIPIFVSPNQ